MAAGFEWSFTPGLPSGVDIFRSSGADVDKSYDERCAPDALIWRGNQANSRRGSAWTGQSPVPTRPVEMKVFGGQECPPHTKSCRASLDWTAEGGCPYVSREDGGFSRAGVPAPHRSKSRRSVKSRNLSILPLISCLQFLASCQHCCFHARQTTDPIPHPIRDSGAG